MMTKLTTDKREKEEEKMINITEITELTGLKKDEKEEKMTDLKKLTVEELNDLVVELTKSLSNAQAELDKKIKEEEIRKSINVLEQLREKSNAKYNNIEWTKIITGLDKTKIGGYSILGAFINEKIDSLRVWHEGLYVNCDIQDNGKRGRDKQIIKHYTLFAVENNAVKILAKAQDKDWAVNLWSAIENNL